MFLPKRKLSALLLAILALTLPACGGGGANNNTGGVIVTGELNVVSTNPAANAQAVAFDVVIEIQFDSALDAAALPNPAIRLNGPGGAVAGQISYDAARGVLVFTPDNPLEAQSNYGVIVEPGITGVNGNVLADDYTFPFRTDDAPIVEEPHENEAFPSKARALKINANGIGASAFVTEKALSYALTIRPYDKATGFGTPNTLYDGPTGVEVRDSGLAVNASGKGIIAYSISGGDHLDLAVRTFDARTGNADAVHFLDTSAETVGVPFAAIDDAGRALVVWTQRVVGSAVNKAYGKSYDPATGWSLTFRIEPDINKNVFGLRLAMDAERGEAIAAWTLYVGDDRAARARTWSQGSFGAVHTVYLLANTQAVVKNIQVTSLGESFVFFTRANTPAPSQKSLHVVRHRPTGLSDPGWQTRTPIDEIGGENIAMTSAVEGNRVLVAWGVDTPADGTKFQYRHYRGAAGWQGPITLSNLPYSTFQGVFPRVISRGERYTLFHWDYDEAGQDERRATLLVDGVIFTRDVLVPLAENVVIIAGMDAGGVSSFLSRGANNVGLELSSVSAQGVVTGPTRIDSGSASFIGNRRISVDAAGERVILFDRDDDVLQIILR